MEEENKISGNNDISWYAKDEALLRDAASIQWSWTTGLPMILKDSSMLNSGAIATPWLPVTKQYTIPGICVLYTRPTAGGSNDDTSAINTAATNLYSFIRHANSGSRNYDRMDLLIYYLAMSECYSYCIFLKRAYRCAFMSFQQNRYFPRAILEAMGIDPQDIEVNLANFRYGINALVNKLSSLAVPGTLPFFARKAFLYENVYVGGESMKDQYYMYSPQGFWKFELYNSNYDANFPDGTVLKPSTGSSTLVYTPFFTPTVAGGSASPANLHTVEDLLAYGNDMLARILNDTDIGLMSGDTLKAYGSSGIITLNEQAEWDPIVPIFNIEVLNQMKNAIKISPESTGHEDLDFNVYQVNPAPGSTNKSGYLLTNYWWRSSVDISDIPVTNAYPESYMSVHLNTKLITTKTAETGPALTMIATRLIPAVKSYTAAEFQDKPNNMFEMLFGSEAVTQVVMWALKPAFATSGFYEPQWSALTVDKALPNVIFYDVPNIIYNQYEPAFLESFEYRPQVWQASNDVGADEDGFPVNLVGPHFDVDNYALINNQELCRLHDTAMLSMLNVPTVAKAY